MKVSQKIDSLTITFVNKTSISDNNTLMRIQIILHEMFRLIESGVSKDDIVHSVQNIPTLKNMSIQLTDEWILTNWINHPCNPFEEISYNVRISATCLKTGMMQYMERNNISKEAISKLWLKHNMDKFKGASTGNLGYAKYGTPKYTTQTGIIQDTCNLVSWTQWQAE